MSWHLPFLVANGIAMMGWLILLSGVVLDRDFTGAARRAGALLAAAYAGLLITHASEASVLIRDYSITGVQGFFSYPALALAGWVHYLVFDLWVGAWEVDNAPVGMPRLLLIFFLLLTLAVGPLGLCAFLAARRWQGRGSSRRRPGHSS